MGPSSEGAYLPPPPYAVRKRKASPPISVGFLAICLTGVIVIVAGMLVVSSAQFLIVYTGDDYYDTEYDKNLYKNVNTVGKMLMQIGTMFLVIGLLATAFLARDLSANARLGLFIAAAIVVGFSFSMVQFPYYY